MTVPQPQSREEVKARAAELEATADTFGDDLVRWMAAVSREHCDNYLAQLGEPKSYAEFLFMVHEATKAAVLWCVHDLGMELPERLLADPAEIEKRQAERKTRRALKSVIGGVAADSLTEDAALDNMGPYL